MRPISHPKFHMICAVLIAALALATLVSWKTLRASELTTCPDTAAGETAEDCPWAGVARLLIMEAEAGRDVLPLIDTHLPELRHQLNRDASLEGLKKLWGTSLNYDENAKGVIVHPAIVDALAEAMRAPSRQERLVHAGLEHTYAYLFSVLRTPFGYKRARWVRDDIESGFALARGTLGPSPVEGTFFANITYFAGRIGLRFDGEALRRLLEASSSVAGALREYPYAALKLVRLEETVTLTRGDGTPRTATLRTDLVRFPNTTPGRPNTALLIYSVLDSASPGAKLITLFPVGQETVDQILDPDRLGEGKPVISRYNAFVPGLTGATPPLLGTRRIVSERANGLLWQ
jgi:hypothetical protein